MYSYSFATCRRISCPCLELNFGYVMESDRRAWAVSKAIVHRLSSALSYKRDSQRAVCKWLNRHIQNHKDPNRIWTQHLEMLLRLLRLLTLAHVREHDVENPDAFQIDDYNVAIHIHTGLLLWLLHFQMHPFVERERQKVQESKLEGSHKPISCKISNLPKL